MRQLLRSIEVEFIGGQWDGDDPVHGYTLKAVTAAGETFVEVSEASFPHPDSVDGTVLTLTLQA